MRLTNCVGLNIMFVKAESPKDCEGNKTSDDRPREPTVGVSRRCPRVCIAHPGAPRSNKVGRGVGRVTGLARWAAECAGGTLRRIRVVPRIFAPDLPVRGFLNGRTSESYEVRFYRH